MIFYKRTSMIILLLIQIFHLANANELDLLAIKYDTDKSSKWHNYTNVYDNYFSKYRNQVFNFLEIGFYKGASARMWQDYFKLANLHFIDIDQKVFNQYGKDLTSRCHFHIVDQGEKNDLISFLNDTKNNFDIIIDDGGHTMKQQITSFLILFPQLNKGGIYVIEDLCTSYWKIYGGYGTFENPSSKEGTMVFFLQKLVDDLNYISAKNVCADQDKYPKDLYHKLDIFKKDIKSIHFYSSLCFIFKK